MRRQPARAQRSSRCPRSSTAVPQFLVERRARASIRSVKSAAQHVVDVVRTRLPPTPTIGAVTTAQHHHDRATTTGAPHRPNDAALAHTTEGWGIVEQS